MTEESSSEHYLPSKEWELLAEPLKLPRVLVLRGQLPDDFVSHSPFLPRGVRRITVSRNDNYEIEAVAEGVAPAPFRFKPEYKEAGGFLVPFGIDVHDLSGDYYLRGCRPGGWSSTVDYGIDGRPFARFEAKLRVHEVLIQEQNARPRTSHIDWYLNGPRGGEVFPRFGRMRSDVVHVRSRPGVRPGTEGFPENYLERWSSFAFIRLPQYSLLINSVPDVLTPPWADAIGIEYRDQWKAIPDADEREAIGELLSFVFDRRLLYVGSTDLDSHNRLVARTAMSPNAISTRGLCKSGARPPVRFVDDTGRTPVNNLEKVLRSLLRTYLQSRDEYPFQEAIRRCLAANEVPLGVGIPLVQSAIEALMKGWFDTHGNPRHVYIEKSDFDRLFADEIASMKRKLKKRDTTRQLKKRSFADNLLRSIERSFNMSVGDRSRMFYEGIKLPLGRVEKEALGARHSFTHGDPDKSDERNQELAGHQVAFSTLANRVVLRLLEYKGSYVDYTSLDWEERPLDQPLQG